MDALKALTHGFTFEEIVENIGDLRTVYKNEEDKKLQEKENHCSKCDLELKNINGIFICVKCSKVGECETVNELNGWITSG